MLNDETLTKTPPLFRHLKINITFLKIMIFFEWKKNLNNKMFYNFNSLPIKFCIQVRSQSESAALNNMSLKMSRNILVHDLDLCHNNTNSTRFPAVSCKFKISF